MQIQNVSSLFQVVTLILIGIGLFFAVIFHIGTKEPIYDTSVKRRLSITMVNFVVRCSGLVLLFWFNILRLTALTKMVVQQFGHPN